MGTRQWWETWNDWGIKAKERFSRVVYLSNSLLLSSCSILASLPYYMLPLQRIPCGEYSSSWIGSVWCEAESVWGTTESIVSASAETFRLEVSCTIPLSLPPSSSYSMHLPFHFPPSVVRNYGSQSLRYHHCWVPCLILAVKSNTRRKLIHDYWLLGY